MYAIGVCTHCFGLEVTGPGRDACLRCGKPFAYALPLEGFSPGLDVVAAAAPVDQDEIPEELEFRGPCPYCTGPLVARITETSYAIEADVAAAAAGANGAGEGMPEPETVPPAAAGEPGDGEESVTTPEAAPEPA